MKTIRGRGWVYVITNKAMPGLIKIGFSTKDPATRAEDLGGTGAPHPYEVQFDALVFQPYEVEQRVHLALADLNEGKEWFRCTVSHAIQVIVRIAGSNLLLETRSELQKDIEQAAQKAATAEAQARRAQPIEQPQQRRPFDPSAVRPQARPTADRSSTLAREAAEAAVTAREQILEFAGQKRRSSTRW
ncbi:hypothetical protein HDG34_006573 [Paraburkholderia sp. HC6.4b]|uniref:GIY-YIG nuclease family protein n=1 Tax=unclassified Paraburkholderia TaxID=2615204 RepID=UPI00161759E5|nr:MULTISPECIES: GIY-YIG nuclease family protein [unclassified Paraburkholderia]MBB5412596.1 hypothetical protein [Paraburkholderia sp. HC6.4b]MBB5454517.1 hypothetical protein [Paraburkholderia sp. Kb1A]